MAEYRVKKRFLEPSGEWHHPGDVTEFDRERAELFLSRGWIAAYETQKVGPPETRTSLLGRRRKEHAIAQAGH